MGILSYGMRQPEPAKPEVKVKPQVVVKASRVLTHNPAKNLGKYHHPKKGS